MHNFFWTIVTFIGLLTLTVLSISRFKGSKIPNIVETKPDISLSKNTSAEVHPCAQILFLDFDGVMCLSEQWGGRAKKMMKFQKQNLSRLLLQTKWFSQKILSQLVTILKMS